MLPRMGVDRRHGRGQLPLAGGLQAAQAICGNQGPCQALRGKGNERLSQRLMSGGQDHGKFFAEKAHKRVCFPETRARISVCPISFRPAFMMEVFDSGAVTRA